jgi:deoxycytidine triphosphate deaminase
MPTMITGLELREQIEQGKFVFGGDPNCVEGVKYSFRMGTRMLKARYSSPIDANKLSETEKPALNVDPGEVVFVLSEERLSLPADMVALLSPERKLSHAGILTLGGFTLDPGYRGRLLLGLFNFSSTPFPLIPGKKVIAATFYRLEGREASEFSRPVEPLEDFPDELVEVMQKYHPVAFQSVTETIKTNQTELALIREEMRAQGSGFQGIKDSLESHGSQIEKLWKELDTEREIRRNEQDELTRAVHRMEAALSFLRGAAWIVMGVLGTAGALVVAWIGRTIIGA